MVTSPHHAPRGFTLVELLVVIAIVTTILAITITGQRSFDSSTVLSGAAYDLALTIRRAQADALSGLGGTNYGYGIDIGVDSAANGYTLFGDSYVAPNPSPNACPWSSFATLLMEPSSAPDIKTGDCLYTPLGDTTVQTGILNNGVTITGFCAASSCTGSGGINKLDLIFARPSGEAVIAGANMVSLGSAPEQVFGLPVTNAARACIKLAKAGAARYIVVAQSGAITVNTTKPGSGCGSL